MQMTDYKTELQELIQQHNMGTLEYRIIEERGPAHEREFVSEVLMTNRSLGKGSGRSKKEAEQQAAAAALLHLERRWCLNFASCGQAEESSKGLNTGV